MAGFDFTKVCFNGAVEGTTTGGNTCTGSLVANTSGTASGTASTDWACTKDNVTNLIWSLEGGTAGDWTTYAQVTAPTASNSASRCGFASGWRLPTRRELLGIMVNDGSIPMIDVSYFPGTQSSSYWTSDTLASAPTSAGLVGFHNGYLYGFGKNAYSYVRLVRSGQ